MSGIEVQRFQHMCRKGYRAYDNRTEEIQLSQRTTYRAPECRATRNSIQSDHGKEGLCNYGGCPHAGDGQRSQGRDTGKHTASLRFWNEERCRSTGPGACKGTSMMYMKPE